LYGELPTAFLKVLAQMALGVTEFVRRNLQRIKPRLAVVECPLDWARVLQ